ncbi:MAG: OmpA family protein [Proteobacteria bacterium]|nr:MAG: OmpA family protein [Pseudomonadota bacterium]
MKFLRSPAFQIALASLSFLPLQACVTDDQQAAQETIIAKSEAEDMSLPPEATADLQSENVTNSVIKDKIPALTPDDIEADNDPMKIGFETARWDLSETARERILAVAEKLKNDPEETLKIDGHCDERGSDSYNQELSNKRAGAVQKELIRLGISKKRLKAEGYGRSRLLVKGHSEKVYSHNRRVEMIFANK